MKVKRGLNGRTCGEAKKRLKNIIPDLENRQIFYYSRNDRQQMLALCCILMCESTDRISIERGLLFYYLE